MIPSVNPDSRYLITDTGVVANPLIALTTPKESVFGVVNQPQSIIFKTGTPDTFTSTQPVQTGWNALIIGSLEGSRFASYAPTLTETTKKQNNTLWKHIIAEAAKGSGLTEAKPVTGGDAFAGGYSSDLTGSGSDEPEG
jgi:hypothetical protein